ncbi:hypothetical protein F5884DRAFT_38608 [Xylogone sp. PMI_703]|nr:hypothetical protein F5884DRAFT_38608 [Xylogone sp. PMI_703]
MDPDCAICSKPAAAQCDCEAKGLDIAVRQAEQRMMASVLNDIRSWVRAHAQDYILDYFSHLTNRRKEAHAAHMHRITERASYYYNARPHPTEVAAVDAELKRGIDEDWRASVQRYPEVLEYFYGLVDLNLPSDEEPAVRDPPLSALTGGPGGRKVRLREPTPTSAPDRDVERERRRSRPPTTIVPAISPISGSRRERRPGPTYAPPAAVYSYSGY